jgi:hypothetical protein
MDHRGDEVLARVVDELRELPSSDEARVRRIVAAAQAAGRDDETTDEDMIDIAAARRSRFGGRRMPYAWAAGMALAAGLGGFMIGGARDAAPSRSNIASNPAVLEAPVVQVDAASPELAPRVMQFVLQAPRARSVSLVGDFNGWDATATPLMLDRTSGIWSATIALAPGRHEYAFMVDSTIALDPRAPESVDPDLGTKTSVVLVGGR